MKYGFLDDYSEGCHEDILKALEKTNFTQQKAYGYDTYTQKAKELIHKKLENENSSIFFVSGGTQANLIAISASLRPHEGVITSHIGHILGHEAGAIEATGHKIIPVFTGKKLIKVKNLKDVLKEYDFYPHKVKPKLLYLSNATEIGTVYCKKELEKLYTFCQKHSIYLYMDGARLAHALTSKKSDLSLKDLTNLTDAFTMGATKNGGLLGEAVVINNKKIAKYFGIHIKQRGALLAKGRVLGVQFLELFKDDLYFDLALRANTLAWELAAGFEKKGYKPTYKVQTNQIFLTLPNKLIKKLREKFDFHTIEEVDSNRSTIRLVTSWATKKSKIDEMLELI